MSFARRAAACGVRGPVAAVVCASLLALAACSGGPEDDPEPIIRSDAASESPSAEPTPEPWEKRTKAGAVAFVKHWVDVFNEAGATGDTTELREISAAGCESCEQFADIIDKLERRAAPRCESTGGG